MSDSHGNALEDYPEEFNIYNFSAPSDSYFDMERKLNFLIEKNAIDTLILTVDNHTLSPYRESLNNLDRSKFYLTRSGYDTTLDYYVDKLYGFLIISEPKIGLLIQEYMAQELKTIFNKPKFSQNNLNKTWKDIGVKERAYRINRRFESQFGFKNSSQKLQRSLERMIGLCKANNIVLIGIKFPLTASYYRLIKNKDMGAAKILETSGFKVMDFSKTYFAKETLFENEDHLNSQGGDVFTRLLHSNLRQLSTLN
ncbi:hypothetical protein [Mesonia sp. HuA40]|uniref:hypothetical protein n=1 Tax=Mesonia sp. HuA40 TaxID=2602761 RepID=UPI0011C900B3|nr:hypothetical protein [Mesonia sp. HuA40]TXK71925.1 hypothetical protein FT993_08420 [Mesonia sp. HuA40]